MTPKVEIRAARTDDVPHLHEIAKECFSDPWSARTFCRTLTTPNSALWCACVDDTIAGYLCVTHLPDAVSVDGIAIDTAYRRRGLAHALLTYLHEKFPTSPFWLEVRASNTPAIALYTSLGYVPVGRRPRYYTAPNEDAILMTKYPCLTS